MIIHLKNMKRKVKIGFSTLRKCKALKTTVKTNNIVLSEINVLTLIIQMHSWGMIYAIKQVKELVSYCGK